MDGVEFDEVAAGQAAFNLPKRRDLAFVAGAKWQFDQMNARVGMMQATMQMRGLEMQRLEARLQESEASVKRIDDQLLFRVNQVEGLEDKLTAAEAKVKKLEEFKWMYEELNK